MTAHIISSGQTSTYDSLNAGDTVSVLSGGESDGSVIVSAAVEYVFSSGFSVGDTVNAGATQVIEFGGLAFFDTVLGSQYVYGSAVDDTISGADAYQYVEGGGTAVGETLLDTGYQSALNGALTSGTQIGSTGVEFVLSGAISISTTVSAGGDLDVYSGGQVSAATVLAGGFLEELGVVGGALIGSSTDAGLVEGLTVGDPFVDDTLEVLEGGSALGVTVTIGGDYLDVDSGGTATGTIVSSGGTESVASGGVTTGDLVLASGIETLASGATAGDVTVSAGGFLGGPGLLTGESNTVAGTVSGVVVGDSVNVDTLEILAGGAAVSVTVTIIDDVLTVDSGGTATGTAIVDEASAVIYGSAIDTKVGSAGICYVESGGVTSGDIVRASGTEILTAGATARSVTVAAGGFLGGPGTLISVNTAAGTVSGVVVGDPFYDDSLEIRAGGAAQNVTTYINGDYLMVDSGATATGTVDSAGGYDIVKGTVTGTTVMSASTEYVYSGGVANATTVRSAGAQYLIGGGTDVGGSVASGGALVLESTSLGAGISIVLGVNAAGTLSGMTLSAGALIDLVDVTLLTGATDAIGVSGVAIESILEGGREHVRSGGYSDDTVISSGGIEYLLNTGSSISATVSSGGSIYTSSGGMAFDTTIRVGGSIYVSSAGQSISAVLYSGGAETVLLSGIASATHVVSGGAVHVSSGGATSVTRLTGGERTGVLGRHSQPLGGDRRRQGVHLRRRRVERRRRRPQRLRNPLLGRHSLRSDHLGRWRADRGGRGSGPSDDGARWRRPGAERLGSLVGSCSRDAQRRALGPWLADRRRNRRSGRQRPGHHLRRSSPDQRRHDRTDYRRPRNGNRQLRQHNDEEDARDRRDGPARERRDLRDRHPQLGQHNHQSGSCGAHLRHRRHGHPGGSHPDLARWGLYRRLHPQRHRRQRL